MAYDFVPCDAEESLLPPSLLDWLPQDHLALSALGAVGEIHLSRFYVMQREDGLGRAAFEPSAMVALSPCAYSTSIASSRKIEAARIDDVAFRAIPAYQKPDRAAITPSPGSVPAFVCVQYEMVFLCAPSPA